MPNAAAGGKGGKGGGSAGGKGGYAERSPTSGAGPRPGDWPCTLCGTPDNRAWRSRCRTCEANRNRAMAKAMEAAAKPQPNFAERQLHQQRTAQQSQRREEAEKKRLREANAKLAAEVAALKAKQAQTVDEGDDDVDMDEGDEDSFETWSEEARAKRVELAKGGLAYAIEKYGEDSPEAEGLRQEIATIQRASRQAKPFKAHRAQLERRRERLQKQQERDENEISQTETEVAELQTKLETLRAAVEERTRAIKEVTSELTELVRKSIAEGSEGADDETPPGSQEESPWSKVSSAIKGIETLPGIPPELATLFARVQEAAVAMASMSNQTASASLGKAGGAAQPGKGQQATTTPTTPSAGPAEPPTVLAPHGRFGKSAAKAAAANPPRAKPPPPQPQDAHGTEEGARRGEGSGDGASAGATGTGSVSTYAEAVKGGATAASDSGSELLEEVGGEEDPMQIELESSLAKLPEGDQKKLRAALERGRSRGKGASKGEAENDDSRRGDRERSPRPTKGGEDKES